MSPIIRTYRNSDAHTICSVWNQHYVSQHMGHQIDAERLEMFCLAKPYFNATQLWVAEDAGQVVGFLHAGPQGIQDQNEINPSSLVISALCVLPRVDESEIARKLIKTCLETAVEIGAPAVFFKPTLPDCPFYLGLGPADSMAGATTADARACGWLTESGFLPTIPTSLWELELAIYKPPIDRTQIQIRRSAAVSRQVEEPCLPWWLASVLGHTEPTSFQLTHRKEKKVLAEILYWMLAPDLQTSTESIVWLWPPDLAQVSGKTDELLFLLAESLREFQSERVEIVRTVTAANDNSIAAILRRLGFSPTENGMVFSKRLNSKTFSPEGVIT